jgi:hypothetical protein
VDKHIRAYIDDDDEALKKLIGQYMIHGPCGDDNPKCGCMRTKKGKAVCRFNYPKKFSEETNFFFDNRKKLIWVTKKNEIDIH